MTMQVARRMTGAAGNPTTLKSGQLAYTGVEKRLVIGHGDDGSGNATSIEDIGGSGASIMLTGDQTVAGIKTFSSSPVVPTATLGDNSTKTASTAFVQAAVSDAGGGDMLSSFYDSDDDGKVNAADVADNVDWEGITGMPSTFAPAAHDASLITTGTIDIARLPVLPGTVQVVSTGGIAALDSGQQASIGDGSVVTTTDGRRWIYTGTGTKTVEASYIEMADVTPEWSVIANKPTTLAGYSISDAQPLDATLTAFAALTIANNKGIRGTGTDTFATYDLSAFALTILDDADGSAVRTTIGCGTMASQAASAVAITGGTISGVTIDDGTF